MIYHPRGEGSLLDASQNQWQALRGSQLAMIFQDPMTALNPVPPVGEQLLEAVNAHRNFAGRGPGPGRGAAPPGRHPGPAAADARLPVHLDRAACCSGRIAIALASSPRLLLADEPTTSLDVIIQDQILSLCSSCSRTPGWA